MTNKEFLIVNDEELDSLEQKVANFVSHRFGPAIINKAEVVVAGRDFDELYIEIRFKELRKLYSDEVPSIVLLLHNNGLQPFSDGDDSYHTKNVFQFLSCGFKPAGMEFYGVSGEKLLDDFMEYLFTC